MIRSWCCFLSKPEISSSAIYLSYYNGTIELDHYPRDWKFGILKKKKEKKNQESLYPAEGRNLNAIIFQFRQQKMVGHMVKD